MSLTIYTVSQFGRDSGGCAAIWIDDPKVFTDKTEAYAYYNSICPVYDAAMEDLVLASESDVDYETANRFVTPTGEQIKQSGYSAKRPFGASITESVIALPTVRYALDLHLALRNLNFIKIASCTIGGCG